MPDPKKKAPVDTVKLKKAISRDSADADRLLSLMQQSDKGGRKKDGDKFQAEASVKLFEASRGKAVLEEERAAAKRTIKAKRK